MQTPPGGNYRLVVYNTSDISQVRVNIDNIVLSLTANDPWSAEALLDPWLNPSQQLNNINFEVFSSLISLPFDSGGNLQPNHPNFHSFTWGFDIFQGHQLIYRNRDGQRENLYITHYNGNAVGSGALFNQPAAELGQKVLDEKVNFYFR